MTDNSAPIEVTADRDACVGAGNCFVTAPTVFDLDEAEGTVLLLRSTLEDPREISDASRAAAGCPAAAIEISGP